MNKITSITKRDIYELFRDGIEQSGFLDFEPIKYHYFGRLSEIEFLERLYNLDEMPSCDTRYENAKDDIIQHTVNNDDYEYCWVFNDDRFKIKNGNDEQYLDFLCEIFDPEVRYEQGYWKDFFNRVNNLIKNDGFEMYVSKKISGKNVFSWRIFDIESSNETIFFSERNRAEIKNKTISFSIPRQIRKKIVDLLQEYNDEHLERTETNFEYVITTFELVFLKLKQNYTPKHYNTARELVDAETIVNIIDSGSPYNIFDIIEVVYSFADIEYEYKINTFLKSNNIPYQLLSGKIQSTSSKINTAIVKSAQQLKTNFSSEYLSKQIDLMLKMQLENPTEAIGKAKELVESCCKTILENLNIAWDKKWDVGQLSRETLKNLKLMPNNISETAPASTEMKALLGNLSAIATNLAALRNPYGSGHGKSASYKGLEVRHAKLAVGSSIAFVSFLWDTYEKRINP